MSNEDHDHQRRAADKVQDDIDSLIAAENDPKERAILIVLQSINRSLIANTISTQAAHLDLLKHRSEFVEHLDNFKLHAINEEALMNRARGGWMVLAFFLTLAQGFAIYAWNSSRDEINSAKAESRAAIMAAEQNKLRLEHLEKAK